MRIVSHPNEVFTAARGTLKGNLAIGRKRWKRRRGTRPLIERVTQWGKRIGLSISLALLDGPATSLGSKSRSVRIHIVATAVSGAEHGFKRQAVRHSEAR